MRSETWRACSRGKSLHRRSGQLGSAGKVASGKDNATSAGDKHISRIAFRANYRGGFHRCGGVLPFCTSAERAFWNFVGTITDSRKIDRGAAGRKPKRRKS